MGFATTISSKIQGGDISNASDSSASDSAASLVDVKNYVSDGLEETKVEEEQKGCCRAKKCKMFVLPCRDDSRGLLPCESKHRRLQKANWEEFEKGEEDEEEDKEEEEEDE